MTSERRSAAEAAETAKLSETAADTAGLTETAADTAGLTETAADTAGLGGTSQLDDTAAQMAAAAAEQLVEWVDVDGTVLDVVTRADMRARGLRHRSVYVAVLSPTDQVLIHRRADWKDVFPGAWDLAFGGVCDPGESWLDAAQRELFEEAGLDLPAAAFADLGPVAWEAPGVALIGQVFAVVSDGPFAFNDGEVTATEWVQRDVLTDHLVDLAVPTDSLDLVLPLLNDLGRGTISGLLD